MGDGSCQPVRGPDLYALRPHLAYAHDARKAGKRWDVAGLYLNPPDKVLALIFDRMPKRPAERVPEEMAGFVAALKELESRVVGDSRWRPRQQACLTFLRRIERAVPDGTIHLIVDRAGTHRQGFVQTRLKRRRRFRPYPAPVSGEWLTWATRWLGELSRKRSPKGFAGAVATERAIKAYLACQPVQPHPFAWPEANKQAAP